MTIDTDAFVDSLPIMGVGLLGIFIVTGVLIIGIYVLKALTRKKAEPLENPEAAATPQEPSAPKESAMDLLREREKKDFLESDDTFTISNDL